MASRKPGHFFSDTDVPFFQSSKVNGPVPTGLVAVAAALFGSPDAIELVAIPYSDRVDVLADGTVDMVVDTFTINCVRDDRIDIRVEQAFEAGHQALRGLSVR